MQQKKQIQVCTMSFTDPELAQPTATSNVTVAYRSFERKVFDEVRQTELAFL
jgi:hypothetical protein